MATTKTKTQTVEEARAAIEAAAAVIEAEEQRKAEARARAAEKRAAHLRQVDEAVLDKYDAIRRDLVKAGTTAADAVIEAVEALDLSRVLPLEAEYHAATVARTLLVERYHEARDRLGRHDLGDKPEVRTRPSRLFSEGGMNGAGYGEGLLIEQVRKRSWDIGYTLLVQAMAEHGIEEVD